MKYKDIRKDIKSGDILAWSHRGWKSWYDIKIQFVRIFTRSEYSHVGTAWVIGDRVFVIEAVQPKVRIYPLSKLKDFYWIPMNAPWLDSTLEYALEAVGDNYSQAQALQAPFNEPKEDSLHQCAELTARTARKDGIELGTVYTPSEIVRNAQLLGNGLFLVEDK